MAEMEQICSRLCLLSRMAWKESLPPPMSRATFQRMHRLGALEGLNLRNVPDISEELYQRTGRLLARSAQVYDQVQRYLEKGYRIITPLDDEWPVNLCALGIHMPQYLFVKGDVHVLSRRCVSVAGSRRIAEGTLRMARACGKALAVDGYAMISGGAFGVDMAAQRGLLDAGGNLVLVPAISEDELQSQRYYQRAMQQGKLLLVCDTPPDEPFSAAKALGRNHVIYALGDAALVVASRTGKGGSWRGASDCLRGGYTPVFAIKGKAEDFSGNLALIEMGAQPVDPRKPLCVQLFDDREGERCRS